MINNRGTIGGYHRRFEMDRGADGVRGRRHDISRGFDDPGIEWGGFQRGNWRDGGNWRDRMGGFWDRIGGLFNQGQEAPTQSIPGNVDSPFQSDHWNPYENILGANRSPSGITTIGSMLARQPTI